MAPKDAVPTSREYVWGPGDGRGGVDELLVMFDRDRNDGPSRQPWFVLQNDGGDTSGNGVAGACVCTQWSYDAYGECLSANSLLPHPTMHAGHKGLFIDRLDEGLTDNNIGDPTRRDTNENSP